MTVGHTGQDDAGARGVRPAPDRPELRADCGSCFALCCVALPFARSADFAVDKGAGRPCHNLQDDFRCGIHQHLRQEGFPGCTVYDCFGAGQKVSQTTFGGQDWRSAPGTAGRMFEVFPVVRQLHELLWYLTEALALPDAAPVHDEARRARDEIDALTRLGPEELTGLDVAARHAQVNPLLLRVSELVRAPARAAGQPAGQGRDRGKDRRGADLIGARLRGADLHGADLRGAYLIGADLRGADLRLADLIGADLRGADLAGADLRGSVFLTQPQLNSARGDVATKIPRALTRPAHWGAEEAGRTGGRAKRQDGPSTGQGRPSKGGPVRRRGGRPKGRGGNGKG
ncbi:pentapeptide repeat-containing protein [Nonomuraea sp. 3-1Str]|uniref:pentapeptide repeat-containing protein n=1 Tax=Nonomuraea sp. 3-1Str TaxID=2929801 RepID=UPI0028706B93|nr:pentapeptide repeat-containing protein [Nonomuraea sp. 3-1Str]